MQCEALQESKKQKQGDQFEGYCDGPVRNDDGLDNRDECGKRGPILEIF